LLDENPTLLPNPASMGEFSAREKLRGMSCTYGPVKKNAGGVVQPFPGKLLEVLDRSDFVDIIDWMPHGRAFIVKKPKMFTTNVLPRFFKQTKFLSFTRQLNLWGFKRITRGADAGAYYHELFLRGRHYLTMRMRRKKIKGTGTKLTPNPDNEPDFYNDWPVMPPLNERRVIPPLPPLPPGNPKVDSSAPIDMAGNYMLKSVPEKNPSCEVTTNRLSKNGFKGAAGEDTTFGNQIHQFGMRHANSLASSLNGSYKYPDANLGTHNDLLLAPGVSQFKNASRLRHYLDHPQPGSTVSTMSSGTLSRFNEPISNDPIQDQLSATICCRKQPINAAMSASIYSPQQLSYDRLFRDLDRAQNLKNDARNARLFESSGTTSCISGVHTHFTALNTSGDGLSPCPFNQYAYSPPSLAYQGAMNSLIKGSIGGEDPFVGYRNDHVKSSVTDALCEAIYLEELVARRAKAQSLALAGALHSRLGSLEAMPESSKNALDQFSHQLLEKKERDMSSEVPKNEAVNVGDSRPSFGRPFGRKE